MNNHMQLQLVGDLGSIDLNSQANSIYLTSELTGLTTLPGVRTTSGNNIGVSGGWTSVRLYEPRLITINGVIANQDVEIVEQKRRDLIKVLGQRNLKLKFVSEAGHAYVIDVYCSGLDMPLTANLKASAFHIDLRADDPVIYDNTNDEYDSVSLTAGTDVRSGFGINFTLPMTLGEHERRPVIENIGNTEVSPIIIFKGPLVNPMISNVANNNTIGYNGTLSASETCVIDTKNRTILVNGVSVYSKLKEGSEWLTLVPGDNEMYFVADGTNITGTAEIRFKSGYLGI